MNKTKIVLLTCLMVLPVQTQTVYCQEKLETFREYIMNSVATEEELDVFLNETSWAQFDKSLGYVLGNYSPHDGIDESFTISTTQENGARTSFNYSNKHCRINTYGNSFTQCHQVNDAETWQEYLAGHLGEPIRNFGMGGIGVYQSYLRMLREENTENSADYILFYIWGDDHIRSLLRCRYVYLREWKEEMNKREGNGKMFHGNFWPNIEMNFESGKLEEHCSRIQSREELYKMTDTAWMAENLIDDLALQMYLYKLNRIADIDQNRLTKLAQFLGSDFKKDAADFRQEVGDLLDDYAFAATEYILKKTNEYIKNSNKKLMVILFDPYGAMRQMLDHEPRNDQQIIDFIKDQKIKSFDMNLVHVDDYRSFNLPVNEYYKRYFIGHYNPSGNHFFAYSIKDSIVKWLDPPPFTYRKSDSRQIDFKGYLEGY